MKIKVIATGSSRWDRFIRRWGVSFLIGEDILFDTFGDPKVFLKNAKRVGVNFDAIRHIVLSHDDWDHIAGLWDFIEKYKNLTVYICPNFRQDVKDRIKSFGVPFIEVNGLFKIKDGVFSTGEIEAFSGERKIYEQALAVKYLKQITIITGCAHPGIVRIVNIVRGHFCKEKDYAVMGGFHLKDSSELQIKKVISDLRDMKISRVAPMHCTGKLAQRIFKKEYGIDFMETKAGSVVEI
jgi:7,8-dihydropterin-6-yl-methyl-4-(beta-D-ribofuranosyl)aminobenzene 5'-phosphate synthase